MGSFLLVALVALVIIAYRNRAKLVTVGNLGAAMPQGINTKLIIGGVVAVLAIGLIWWFWDDITGNGFYWKLLACGLVIFIGLQVSKGITWSIGRTIFWVGVAGLTFVILSSKLDDGLESTINNIEANGGSGIFSFESCPDETQDAKVGGTYEVVRGCDTLRLVGKLPLGVSYEVIEGAHSALLEDHLDIRWPYTTIRTFALSEKVPETTQKIVFRIVSPEESAELDLQEKKQQASPDFAKIIAGLP